MNRKGVERVLLTVGVVALAGTNAAITRRSERSARRRDRTRPISPAPRPPVLVPSTPPPPRDEDVAAAAPRPRNRSRVLLAAAFFVGLGALGLSFTLAGRGGFGTVPFVVFWVGFLIFAAPAALRACAAHTSDAERWVLIALLGLWDFVPKLLRDPTGPLFSDELAHWSQASKGAASGTLDVQSTLIPFIRRFPGLEALVSAIHAVTGLSLWQSGQVVVAIAHVAALVAVMIIAFRISHSSRAAAIAAVIYAVNPSFMFFDSQFSYESLGIVLFLWTVAAAVTVADEPSAGWWGIGALAGLACVATHHLSSYILVAVLLGLAVVTRKKMVWTLAAVVTAGAAAWLAFVAQFETGGYYGPFLTGGVQQLTKIVGGSGGQRTLFAKSAAPSFEQICGFLAPPLVAAGALASMWYLWRRRGHVTSAVIAIGVLGVSYFLSLPFIFTTSGNEAARRSWAFSYLGLAILLALVLHEKVRTKLAGALVAAAVVIMLVGNTSSSVNVQYRFPGPYVYGSDTRSLTAEQIDMTDWFVRTLGPGNHVITDRYTALTLASFGEQEVANPSSGFPAWDLFLSADEPSRTLLQEMKGGAYRYVVIDRRMFSNTPLIGVYFTASEPGAFDHATPPPQGALTRWDHEPWATKVYDSTNYVVFRLDLDKALS
jgi:hypothetical protein